MNIASALAQASQDTVEAAGLHWRLRRITSAELMEAGGGILLAVAPRRKGEKAVTAEDLAADPKKLASMHAFNEAVVCAAVQQVSRDGVTWEEITFLLDRRGASPGSGRVHVSALPSAAVTTIAGRVMSLSTDGGAAADRIASFLG